MTCYAGTSRRRVWVVEIAVTVAGCASLLLGACSSGEPANFPVPEESHRPNVLLIVADDLAFSDLGAFGGEIDTPNLDMLADHGLRLTQFYTAPTCSPTRSMLMTGRDHHSVGLGSMAEIRLPAYKGRANYQGSLFTDVPTIAERLRDVGYTTLIAGKWHLGTSPTQDPSRRGFNQSFSLLQGAHNHFGLDQTDIYRKSGETISYTANGAPVRYEVGRLSSDVFADHMIDMLQSADPDLPFFGYLAFTAPHWPLQAAPEDIAKYRGRYDAGPAALRSERLTRMKALGIIDVAVEPHGVTITKWASMAADARAIEARRMEIYAAMVDRLDRNVGRVLEELRRSDKLDNTIVVFMSDNGPDGNLFNRPQSHSDMRPLDIPFDNSLANMGAGNSYLSYGPDWAAAGAAPSRGLKGSTSEGGIRVPAIISGPGFTQLGISARPVHVLDIPATIAALAGLAPTGLDGQPLLSANLELKNAELLGRRTLAWELFFQRAVRRGPWKAVYVPRRNATDGLIPTAPATWELFHLATDPGETRNLADRPDVLADLVSAWGEYARRNDIILSPH